MKPETKAQRAASAFTPTTARAHAEQDASELLTVSEVAVRLRVKPRYVYQLASSGAIDRTYVGRYVRIPLAALEAYIQSNTVAAAPAPARRPGARPRCRLRAVHRA